MSQQTYLTCQLQKVQYAISTEHVREIFPLPELQIVPEVPSDILGILNLRGHLLPVMHLRRRISKAIPACRPTDSVIVVDCQGLQVGIIVDQVSEVCVIEDSNIDQDLSYGRQGHVNTAFLNGVATVDDVNVLLLNPAALISLPDEVADWVGESTGFILEATPDVDPTADFYQLYFPTATAADRQLLHQRALDLRSALATNEDTNRLVPLAVFKLADEYFGMDLELVREFINTHNIRTIPCCPREIMGNMNLRGEILTLVDIRPTLNLDTAPTGSQAIVAQVGDVVAGISIDELHDILYLDPAVLATLPVANQSSRQGLIESTVPYRETLLSILNVPQVLGAA